MAYAFTGSRLRVEWMWKLSIDSQSTNGKKEWYPFSDVETIIIEQAYQHKLPEIRLDSCYINFKRLVQITNTDKSKQRPVKRVAKDRTVVQPKLREERFAICPSNPTAAFGRSDDFLGFLDEFLQHFSLYDDSTLRDIENRQMVIKKAAEGIITEGKLVGKQIEAEWLAKQLLNVKDGSDDEIWRCCARLYTMETFLYQKMNEYMHLEGDKNYELIWKSKVPTFGPFACLLANLPVERIYKKMTVYRGSNLTDDLIQRYRHNVREYVNFPAFTSTCRNRKKAEQHGNALFIMEISSLDAYDVSPYSDYPDEEETLVKADFAFYIRSCAFDKSKEKWTIHLSALKDE